LPDTRRRQSQTQLRFSVDTPWLFRGFPEVVPSSPPSTAMLARRFRAFIPARTVVG
jgi:hypothetical protein